VGVRARDSTEAFWAFPSALQRLKAALHYEARNYDLDESIGSAPGFVKIIIEYYAAVDHQLRARRVERGSNGLAAPKLPTSSLTATCSRLRWETS
jgi:hypothetical protein